MLVLMILLGLVIAVILLILILSSNSKKTKPDFHQEPLKPLSAEDIRKFYTIDGQYFPPESLTKRSIDEVIANSRLKLVRGSDVQSLHPIGHEGLFYVFNDRGNLEEICISADYNTDFFGISTGYPERVLQQLGYEMKMQKVAGSRNTPTKMQYWVKGEHYVVISRVGASRKGGVLTEMMYTSGALPKKL